MSPLYIYNKGDILKKYECSICNISFQNFQLKANHVRWYHKKNYTTNGLKSLKEKLILFGQQKTGIIKDFEVFCKNCNKSFIVQERDKIFPKKEKYFCSRSCANKRVLTNKTKNKISQSIKNCWNKEEYREKCTAASLRLKRFTSKCEREIRDYFISNFKGDEWTYGRLFGKINSDLFSKKLKIAFEYDGIWHFKDIYGQLKEKQKKDKLLENWCKENNWKLIRMKDDLYVLDKEYWLQKIINEIYFSNRSGIIKFY